MTTFNDSSNPETGNNDDSGLELRDEFTVEPRDRAYS
jgi:hypothetical protein